MFKAFYGDGDLAVFNICLDQRFVLADFQHHASAPDEVIFNLLVHADNEAGDDAGGQNGIGILKGRDAVEFQFGGFVFGQQIRDKEGFISFDVVAEFELFHHVHDEETFAARIFGQVEDLIEYGCSQHTLVLEQGVRVENFVHAIGDPLRIENAEYSYR